jgi:hypothetical protein
MNSLENFVDSEWTRMPRAVRGLHSKLPNMENSSESRHNVGVAVLQHAALSVLTHHDVHVQAQLI